MIGEATNSKDALSLLKSCPTDVAIVDLRLGVESGLHLIKSALEQQIQCKFVVLTSSTSEADFVKAKEIGVEGYLLKEALPEELLHGLQLIYKGRKYYDPSANGSSSLCQCKRSG
ncbi:response regulator transcription factor [Solibacillus isronensis]